ncbi:hypothetical protein niasHT_039141 [Heterodera trifolii]|uniref:Peptidase M41 domain-containing protein n=1 Tax=Heterodera trifolii TaxID=157864 RepID=A0ABD2HRQ9_9BILA
MRRTALHEVGHLKFLWDEVDCIDEFRKITAAADRRDGSAGAVHFRPPAQNKYTRAQLKAKLQLSLGGRAAEEVFFTRCVGDGFDSLEWPELATKIAETSDQWKTLPLGRRTRARLNELRDSYIDHHLLSAKEAIERDKKKLKKNPVHCHYMVLLVVDPMHARSASTRVVQPSKMTVPSSNSSVISANSSENATTATVHGMANGIFR